MRTAASKCVFRSLLITVTSSAGAARPASTLGAVEAHPLAPALGLPDVDLQAHPPTRGTGGR